MEAIRVVRSPAAGVLGFMLLLGSAQAQLVHRGADPWQPAAPSAFAASPGLQLSRVEYPIGCGASLLRCEPGQLASFAASRPSPLHWNLELSQLSLGAADRFAVGSARQGLNLSLVGRRALFGSSLSVYGKLGATYGYAEAGATPMAVTPGALEQGYGLSFGAGLSLDFTPQLSATLGWDSHDLRLGGREGFRSTSLGLQYRY